MTIVQFVTSKTFGGVESHICTLVRLLKDEDYKFKVVCHQSNAREFRDRLDDLDIEIISFNSWFKPFPTGYKRLIQIFKEISPDILHCHLYSATRAGALAAKIAGINYVVETIHMEEAWRKGFKKFLFNNLDAVIGRLFIDKYIAVSKSVAQYYQKSKRVSKKKIDQIYNTIETNDIKKDVKKKYSCRLGYLGRLSHEKGLDVLIDALYLLKKHHESCFKLFIGGSGTLRQELEQQVQKLGIEDSVTFLGQISDKSQFFKGIDIFILPSRSEGFSLVLLEAAAYQMPVVASNVSGNPEIIRHEETGILVDKEDPEGLVSAIKTYQDKEKRERYSKNLRSLFESDFSPSVYEDKMDAFYKSLVQ